VNQALVLRRFLHDGRRSTLGWTVGIVALVAFTVGFFPSVKGQASVDEVVRNLPDAVKAVIGLEEGVSLTSPAGYLHGRLFSTVLPVVLLTFGVGLGARAIGGSEADGTLELLLSNPVTRRRVLVERYVATAGLVAGVGLAFFATLLALAPAVGLLEGLPVARLAGASAAATCLALLHATLAFAVGSARGRTGPAVAVATAVAVAGYLIQGLAATSGSLGPLAAASPWHWYLERNILVEGLAARAVVTPLLLSAVLAVAATWIFERRDLR
jgi:ABC-2 type transport system permease protein